MDTIILLLLKATALLLLAITVGYFLKSRPATLRAFFYGSFLICLPLILIFSGTIPADLSIPLIPKRQTTTAKIPEGSTEQPTYLAQQESAQLKELKPQQNVTEDRPTVLEKSATQPPPVLVNSESKELSVAQILALVWLSGVAISLCAYLFTLINLKRLQRIPASKKITEFWDKLRGNTSAQINLSPQISMPVVHGLFRREILLPEEAQNWDESLLRSVLLHEQTHITRHDIATRMLANFARSLFWFHPLALHLYGKLIIAQEEACDEQVIASGISPARYAQDILTISQNQENRLTAGLAMSDWSSFGQRIKKILTLQNHPDKKMMKTTSKKHYIALACLPLSISFSLSLIGYAQDLEIEQNPEEKPSSASPFLSESQRKIHSVKLELAETEAKIKAHLLVDSKDSKHVENDPAVVALKKELKQLRSQGSATDSNDQKLRYGTLLSRSKYDSYDDASYSFRYGGNGKDIRKLNGNDWDLQFDNGRNKLDVHMHGGDDSSIIEIGKFHWNEGFKIPSLPNTPKEKEEREEAIAKEGHLYFVHSKKKGEDDDLYTLFRVESHKVGDQVIISWKNIEASEVPVNAPLKIEEVAQGVQVKQEIFGSSKSILSAERIASVKLGTLLSRRKYSDYANACYSFKHAGNGETIQKLCRNNWEIQFGNGGDSFHVNMVTDDRSQIKDLGKHQWGGDFNIPKLAAYSPENKNEDVKAQPGHIYFVHSKDSKDEFYALFRIESLTPEDQVTISWTRFKSMTD